MSIKTILLILFLWNNVKFLDLCTQLQVSRHLATDFRPSHAKLQSRSFNTQTHITKTFTYYCMISFLSLLRLTSFLLYILITSTGTSKYHGCPKTINYCPNPLKKMGLQPTLKPLKHRTIHIYVVPHTLLHKMQIFYQNMGQVWLHPIGPQHSHVTHPKSLSFFASNICCDLIVGNVVLL